MNDQGQVQAGCQVKLREQSAPLLLGSGMVAIIIKTNLPNCQYFRFMSQTFKFFEDFVVVVAGVIGVDSDAGENKTRILAGKQDRIFSCFEVNADIDNKTNAGFFGAFNDLVAVSIKSVEIKMSVCV